MNVIKIAVSMVLAIAVTVLVVITVYPSITNVSTSEDIVFAENDTYYSLTNSPIYLGSPYTPTLVYSNGTVVEDFTYTSTQVKIGFEVTADTYTAGYTYYKGLWLGGRDYTWAVTMLMYAGLVLVCLYFTESLFKD